MTRAKLNMTCNVALLNRGERTKAGTRWLGRHVSKVTASPHRHDPPGREFDVFGIAIGGVTPTPATADATEPMASTAVTSAARQGGRGAARGAARTAAGFARHRGQARVTAVPPPCHSRAGARFSTASAAPSPVPFVVDMHTHFLPIAWPDYSSKYGDAAGPWPWMRPNEGGDPGRAMLMLGEEEFRPVHHACWDIAKRCVIRIITRITTTILRGCTGG